jgi:hypothetical protein
VVTGDLLPREVILAQVDKLAGSEILKSSESLCRLLRYLADQAIAHPGVSVKEYQIATEVFGRSSQFDSRLDSTVRVQTGRLRSKLAEYYAVEGHAEQTIVEIPRGAYTLAIHERPAADTPAPPNGAPPRPAASSATAGSRLPSGSTLAWIFGLLSLVLCAALLGMILTRPKAAEVARVAQPSGFLEFWGRFVEGPEQPWVIFSNAEFVGRPTSGMRYYDATRDSRDTILDHYTGVGEVLAIHELDRLFSSLRHGIRVKRARLLSLDDAKNNDLIFIGSPSENLPLREIPTTREFMFREMDSGARKGEVAIVNVHPGGEEPSMFLASASLPILEDYAVIGLVPGMNPNRWAMVLAGTTTIGTQAAVEFVCRANNLNELIAKAGRSKSGEIHPFEAVIQTKVSGGVPVSSQIAALHRRTID